MKILSHQNRGNNHLERKKEAAIQAYLEHKYRTQDEVLGQY